MGLKYAVIGSGAIGGYYGGRLANAGSDVHFLYHSEFDFVKANGLRVDSVNGDFWLRNLNVYRSTIEMPICDVVLVCLKSTQNHLLPQMLRPILHKGSVVLMVQNGLGLEDELAASLPGTAIAGGMAFICSSRVGPGHIVHADYGTLTLGFRPQATGWQQVADQVVADFLRAGVSAVLGPDLNLLRWRKLVWNVPYNGLTVVMRTGTDVLMRTPSSRTLVADIMNEVAAAARACGAGVDDAFVEKMLLDTDRMKPYAPSMKLDYDNHRPLEVRAIYSNPLHAAGIAGVDMPKVRMLEQQLLFIQKNELQA